MSHHRLVRNVTVIVGEECVTPLSCCRRPWFFKIVKQIVKDRQDVSGSSCLKDEDGIMVTDSDGVKEV